MPTEPNQKMDKLLRTYARQRRAQADPPLQMHPATRHMLQGEVARTFGKSVSTRPSYAGALPNFWTRLLWGVFGLALLLIGAGLWLRYDQAHDLQIARTDASNLFFFAQSAPDPVGATAPEMAAAQDLPGSESAGKDQKSEAKLPVAKQVEPGPEIASLLATARVAAVADSASTAAPLDPILAQSVRPALADEAMPSLDLGLARAGLADTANSGIGPALPAGSVALKTAPPAVSARLFEGAPTLTSRAASGQDQVASAPATEALASSRRFAARPVAPSQESARSNQALRFAQIDVRNKYRQNLNSPAPPRVLTSFEVERRGQTVRIIDADGSVYSGPLDAPVRPARTLPPAGSGLGASANNQQQAAFDNAIPALARENAALPPFSFRAVGTNRTLNEVVVFSGKFDPGQAVANLAALAASANNQAPAVQSAQQLVQARSAPATMNRAAMVPQANALAESNRLLMPGRIEGRATVGAKNQFKIEAQQVIP